MSYDPHAEIERLRADLIEERHIVLELQRDLFGPLPSGNKTRLEKEVERLRSALAECCAPFDTGPTTVLEGAVLVQAEFQRRMDLAANTLR